MGKMVCAKFRASLSDKSFMAAKARRPMRKATGELATSLATKASTAASKPSGGTTWLTISKRQASWASKRSAKKHISCSLRREITRISSGKIIIGNTPTRASVVPNLAVSTATAKSQAQTSPTPPPKAPPLTRAMMGRLQRSMARNNSATGWSKRPGSRAKGEPSAVGLSLPPAQNVCWPAPVSTMARTPGMCSAA